MEVPSSSETSEKHIALRDVKTQRPLYDLRMMIPFLFYAKKEAVVKTLLNKSKAKPGISRMLTLLQRINHTNHTQI